MIDCLAVSLLALMVQSEAPYEPVEGQIAVAYVAINRAEQSGKSLIEVLQQRRQFYINPRVKVTAAVMQVAEAVYRHQVPDPTGGADHFYNPRVIPWPQWFDPQWTTVVIGHHTFLKLGGF